MNKKGLSTIIANVLIVLVAVGAVSLLWIGISPMIAVDIMSYDTKVSLVTSGGYTFFDEFDESVTAQVESSGSEVPDYIQIILTLEDGNELISAHDAPPLNGRMRYYLNVEDYLSNPPLLISVAPMFIVEGEVILGRRSNAIELPKRVESDPEEFYGDREPVSPTSDDRTGSGGGGSGGSGGGSTLAGCEYTTDGCVVAGTFVEVFDCRELGEEGQEYLLMNDIGPVSETCFEVMANDVVLDLGGYIVSGNGGWDNKYGIFVGGYNNTEIKNGFISGFRSGIYLLSSSENILSGILIEENSENGIYLISSSSNILSDLLIYEHSSSGISLSSSFDNVLSGINLSDNGDGILLQGSSRNVLIDINSVNNQNGIELHTSDNNNFSIVSLSGNRVGIFLHDSSNNFLLDINSSSNSNGITFSSVSNNNKIDDSIFCYNDELSYGENLLDLDCQYFVNAAGNKVVDTSFGDANCFSSVEVIEFINSLVCN
jgi:parallel beta-helix repeat protein